MRCPKNMLNGPCGGCVNGKCEVTKALCPWYEKALEALRTGALEGFTAVNLDKGFKVRDYEPAPRKPRSKLLEALDKRKAITYELEGGKRGSARKALKVAAKLKDVVTAFNITDNPLGRAELHPLAIAVSLENMGCEAVLQLACRDYNRSALTSLLLAASALGVKNFLAVTGDWPGMGDNPSAKPVYDLDSTRLVYLARLLSDLGVDAAGNKVKEVGVIHVGVASNPHIEPLEIEAARLLRKRKAGAEFVQTQPFYDEEHVRKYFKVVAAKVELPVMATIAPFTEPQTPKLLREKGGVKIPRSYIELLEKAKSREDVEAVNLDYAERIAEEALSAGAAGIHVITMGDADLAVKVIRAASKIIGRATACSLS